MSELEKYINDYGKECYRGVKVSTPFSDLDFYQVPFGYETDDIQFALHTDIGSLTVLDRVTGFSYGVRDTETGFRDMDGNFWLASGMVDVRLSNAKTVGEAIEFVKQRANTCVPDLEPPRNEEEAMSLFELSQERKV